MSAVKQNMGSGESAGKDCDYHGQTPSIWVSVLRCLLYYFVLLPIMALAGFSILILKLWEEKTLKAFAGQSWSVITFIMLTQV